MAAQEHVDQMKGWLEASLADPENTVLKFEGPLTMKVGYHDGPGVMFYDKHDKPILTDLIRCPDLAVQLWKTLNTLT